MPKISLDNLERYHGHLKDWCDARFAEKKVHENWHEAGPSGAVSFYPVPNSPIDPVVNFAFTETLPSGTKGPDNPSTIVGISSIKVTRCGKNLCPTTVTYKNYNDITVTANTDGSLTFNGTARTGTGFYAEIYHKFYPTVDHGLILKRGEDYTVSMTGDSGISFKLYKTQSITTDDGYGNPAIDITTGETSIVTISSTITGLIFRVLVPAGTTVNNATIKIQIEKGTTATTFEPYSGTDYTVNLGNTYYGGSVDLSTGIMTVTLGARVFTGQETSFTWGVGTTEAYTQFYTSSQNLYLGRKSGSGAVAYCSHFDRLNNSSVHTNIGYGLYGTTYGGYFYYLSSYTTVDDWTNFLASEYANGTPVTVVYQLATPYTVKLTPTQIYSLSQSNPYSPNTVYSDQQSVLVRYPKSPIVSGSELDDAILSLGGD